MARNKTGGGVGTTRDRHGVLHVRGSASQAGKASIPMGQLSFLDQLKSPAEVQADRIDAMSVPTRRATASNPNTSPRLLAQLLHVPPMPELGIRVAGNPNCSAELLRSLSKGSRVERWLVADHPNCPPDIIKDFTYSEYDLRWIAEAATVERQHPDQLGRWLDENPPVTHYNNNLNRSIDQTLYTPRFLLMHQARTVRSQVDLQKILSHRRYNAGIGLNAISGYTVDTNSTKRHTTGRRLDSDFAVCVVVDGTPSFTEDQLRSVWSMTSDNGAHQPASTVARSLASSTHCPPDVLDSLVDPSQEYVMEAIAENPNTNPQTLAELVRSPSKYVKAYAMENPSTPPHIKAIGQLAL